MADDIVLLIQSQHRELERLLKKAEEGGPDVSELLQRVHDLLAPHSDAEEDFVYPAITRLDPKEKDEAKDGVAEHHHSLAVLKELLGQDPEGPGFDGQLAGFIGELQHHVEEEEEDLLSVLSEQASAEQRAELAARFAQATGWTTGGTDGPTRDELYAKAKQQDVAGRSSMDKAALAAAVDEG